MTTLLKILVLSITCQLTAQQPTGSVLGNVDFHALINAVPVLQTSPEAAYEYACNKTIYCVGDSPLKIQYEVFTEKKEFYTTLFESNYAPQVDDFNSTYSSDGYKKLANENDMIQSLGGLDKVMQMTDEEREIAAKKVMASKLAYSRINSFSEAEIQRMMNDPEYAKQMVAKYSNMTAHKKAAIANKKIAAGDFDTSKEANVQKLKDKESSENAQTTNAFMIKITTRLIKAMEACNLKMSHLKSSPGNHEELDHMYKQLYEKIPLLENMVQGKYKDPVKLKKLKLEYALKHKDRATFELLGVQIEQKKLKADIIEVIADYQSFLDTNGYRVNGKIINLFNGTNTEFSLMKVEQNIMSSIDVLADLSKSEDELASKQEQHYQLIISES